MEHSRKERGKAKLGEETSAQEPEPKIVHQEPSLKQHRLMSDFRNRPLILPAYGKLESFPSTRFKFPEFFKYQRIDGFVSDSGPYYPDMVKDIFANLIIDPGCAFRSKVRDNNIGLSLEELENCLGVPYEGERIQQVGFLL
ncbi:hypothetical protein RYX36_023250 [Vicia faba]